MPLAAIFPDNQNTYHMKTLFTSLMLFFLIKMCVMAQAVNYAEHIAPIMYNHCTTCHRQGEIGPFPLESYEDARNYASTIRFVTRSRYMPPWKADPNYQRYQKENFLTDEQIDLIDKWVEADMPRGNPALEPSLPVFPSGSQVGIPDMVLSFKTAHRIKDNNKDEYRYFVLPTGLTEPKDLVALEVRPGNKAIVHHTLCWADSTGFARAQDAATPEYGYSGNGQTNAGMLNNQLPGYVPGHKVQVLTQGIAQRIPANSDILLQMHYAPSMFEDTDSTTVNLFFAREKPKRYLKSNVMVPFFGTLTNGPFVIQPNTKKEFHGKWTLTEDVSIFSVSPHMHLLGTHWKVFAVKPNGENVPLIQIRDWDFNWQGSFALKKLIYLPKGSVIHAYAGYDNTSANPSNPNNPPIRVSWGEGTSDEMYYLPIHYLSYLPGDENLDLEEVASSLAEPLPQSISGIYRVLPNPASHMVQVEFTLAKKQQVSVFLYDIKGNLLKVLEKDQWRHEGLHGATYDVTDIPPGTCFITLQAGGSTHTQKLVVLR
jgi:hypothetical protein